MPASRNVANASGGSTDINALLAEVERLKAQLTNLGATTVPAPEPRFKTVYSLFRELARQVLIGDILHEFEAVISRYEDVAVPAASSATSASESTAS